MELKNPNSGTRVEAGGTLADLLKKQGWSDSRPTDEKPQPKTPRRGRKSKE